MGEYVDQFHLERLLPNPEFGQFDDALNRGAKVTIRKTPTQLRTVLITGPYDETWAYGEHPHVDQALAHAAIDYRMGHIEDAYRIGGIHYPFLFGSTGATSVLDSYLLRDCAVSASAEDDGVVTCELAGYMPAPGEDLDAGIRFIQTAEAECFADAVAAVLIAPKQFDLNDDDLLVASNA